MLDIFKDYLFTRGYFVAEGVSGNEGVSEHAAEALVALGRFAHIRITAHPELANMDMLEVAKRNLGFAVPEAFYRGFPHSAIGLTPFAYALDQALHYLRTYGLGDFSQPGHSLFEESYQRAAFAEHVEPKDFEIIGRDEADRLLTRISVKRENARARAAIHAV